MLGICVLENLAFLVFWSVIYEPGKLCQYFFISSPTLPYVVPEILKACFQPS